MPEHRTSTRRAWLQGAIVTAGSLGLGRAGVASQSSPSRPTPREAVLRALLDRNFTLRPEFGRGLSNHLSMGLFSLAALGASGDRLQALADSNWSRLEPLPTDEGPQVTTANWIKHLGQREALPGFRALFQAQIAQAGSARTLRRFLPGLLPGVGAGAFHALIRTGYGVRFRDDREVADGLAYWAIAFLPLGPLPAPGQQSDPRAALAEIHASATLGGRDLSGRLIFDKMKAAAALPGFAQAVAGLRPRADSLAALSAAAVQLYVATGDFTALHMVTGAHAYRQLSPFIESHPDSIRYLWQALAAAYISIGAPAAAAPVGTGARGPSWRAITSKAAASLDEHDIKLVEVAREEEAFYRDSIYRRAAARRMKLS